MENTEIIKALRYCGNFEDREGCDEECPYFNDKDCPKRIMCDAADVLKAADKRIAELEAQMPKEGEWIMDCLAPQMDAHRIGQWAYAPKCSECGTHWDAKTNYCPSCGAKMKTVTDCHASEDGER